MGRLGSNVYYIWFNNSDTKMKIFITALLQYLLAYSIIILYIRTELYVP